MKFSLRPKYVMEQPPVTKYGFATFSKSDYLEPLTQNGFEVAHVTGNDDIDIELNGEKFENAYFIVKALKK